MCLQKGSGGAEDSGNNARREMVRGSGRLAWKEENQATPTVFSHVGGAVWRKEE